MPPCMGTTSPIGVVWKTPRQKASPWPTAVGSSSIRTSRPRSTPMMSEYETRTTSTPLAAQALDDLGDVVAVVVHGPSWKLVRAQTIMTGRGRWQGFARPPGGLARRVQE